MDDLERIGSGAGRDHALPGGWKRGGERLGGKGLEEKRESNHANEVEGT